MKAYRTLTRYRYFRQKMLPCREFSFIHSQGGVLASLNSQEQKAVQKLKQKIVRTINVRDNKGVNLAYFMHTCLLEPEYGYYTTRPKIFNKGGDFTTSPEISQLFGEMLGIWLYMMKQKVNENQREKNLPEGLHLVEIGPGQGQMLKDIIRTMSQLGNALQNLRITLIEPSEKLRRIQQQSVQQALHKYAKLFPKYEARLSNTSRGRKETFSDQKNNFSLDWFDSLEAFIQEMNAKMVSVAKVVEEEMQKPSEEGMQKVREKAYQVPIGMIAHQVFDALPIYSFQYESGVWCQRLIGLDPLKEGELTFKLSQGENDNVKKILKPQEIFTLDMRRNMSSGDQLQVSLQSLKMAQELAQICRISQGFSLIVDYGQDQGFKHHYISEQDMLQIPGAADLSAYVNFKALKHSAEDVSKEVKCAELMPQGQFLQCMGIVPRVQSLMKSAKDQAQAKELYDEYVRLADPQQMGAIYKMQFMAHSSLFKEVFPFTTMLS